MSSTTLVTFLLQTPPTVAAVDLLGSWDNFTKPYPMERDPRTGRGHWRGCHTFENIICDGDLDNHRQSRSGGLKMGGKYWYFYQLDGDIEYHNPAEPSTTYCPLLPGQPVNVLEVPIEIRDLDSRARSGSTASMSAAICTMNPEDKYLNPRPAPVPQSPPLHQIEKHLDGPREASRSPTSKRSRWSAKSRISLTSPESPLSLNRLLFHARKDPPGGRSRSLSPKRASQSRPALRRSILPRSAGTILDADRGRPGFVESPRKLCISEPVLVSRTDIQRQCVSLDEARLRPATRLFSVSAVLGPDEAADLLLPAPDTDSSKQEDHTSQPQTNAIVMPADLSSRSSLLGYLPRVDFDNDSISDADEINGRDASFAVMVNDVCPEPLSRQCGKHTDEDVVRREDLGDTTSLHPARATVNPRMVDAHTLALLTLPKHPERPPLLRSHFSNWTTNTASTDDEPAPPSMDAASDNRPSPSLSSATDTTTSDPLSPYRLSFQVDPYPTFQRGSFDAKHMSLPRATSHSRHHAAGTVDDANPSEYGSFRGYSLPPEDHASELTLTKLPTPSLSGPLPDAALGTRDGDGSQLDYVRSWNDGSAHRITSRTDELLDDLGYLGGMIVSN